MAIACPKSVNGVAMRLTQTNACGVPVEDLTMKQVLTSGFITATFAPNVEAGTEITVKKADGSLCVARKQGDQLKWLDVTLEMCGIPYPALDLLLGLDALMDETDIVGGVLPSREATSGAGIAPVQLELWSINADNDACAGESGSAYIHWVVPIARSFQISGDITFGEDATNLSVVGIGEASSAFEPADSNDFDAAQITAIQGGGPLAWKLEADLPSNIDDCAYVEVSA